MNSQKIIPIVAQSAAPSGAAVFGGDDAEMVSLYQSDTKIYPRSVSALFTRWPVAFLFPTRLVFRWPRWRGGGHAPGRPGQGVGGVVLVTPLPVLGTVWAGTPSVFAAIVRPRLAFTVCAVKFAESAALLSVPMLPATSVGCVPPAKV